MVSSFPKMQKSSASFSQSIRNRLRLKKLQAQAKNFCRVLDIRVAQIVEADVWQASLLEQNFQSAVGRVRVHGQLRTDRLREDPLADRPLLSLPQEFHDALGQDDGAGTLACLGRAQREHTQFLAVESAANTERPFLLIEVLPHQPADLAAAQSGHELGVEELVPDFILAYELHEGFQLLLVDGL